MNLDEFINFIVPVGILVFVVVAVGFKFREAFSALFAWLGKMFRSGANRVIESSDEIIYR